MKCPKCQFENPEDSLFCGECGSSLEVTCPNCGAKPPPNFKFCNECGYNLTEPAEPSPKELSFDEKLEKIQRYLPRGLTEKILSQRDKIEGERKQVTVMFCDMEGFTPLVDLLGPEKAYSVMDEVYEILIHKVHDYEGTVNEMTGDGIMALFGAPIALEDAPQRAVRSALAIQREITRFNDQKKDEGQVPLVKLRIGIHTGLVVVGVLGNDLRVEFKAVGDTVNLASRMEGVAEPGTIYVSEETFKLTEGFFRFEALGEKEVKGKGKPVKVYRVIAPSTRSTRFEVSAERGLTPFVGRERELELLLDGFERSKQGRGQVFSIVAEAGVGKTRFLYEFRKAVANEEVTFQEGRCLSYSRGDIYHPIADILRSNFDIQEDDSEVNVREKVRKGLKVLDLDNASTLPYILQLMSIEDKTISEIAMSTEERKNRIIETLLRIILKGSELRPLILALEDLHWIDQSSAEVIRYLFESIAGARILLILTYRPDYPFTWGGKSYHNQINLNRFSNRESLTVISNLLGGGEIEVDLESLILEKAEGVPFFIEELIKSLKDLKIIEKKDNKYDLTRDVKSMAIPSTIQDVIMARIDSLPEGAKEVIQTGSVIEREFSYELIKQIRGLAEKNLLSHLSALNDAELLFERGIFPLSNYIFKHALTRDVVYNSILLTRKKELHQKIGRVIEDIYQNNIDKHYSALIEHYRQCEDYEKGAQYSRLAAKKAEKTVSLNEAIRYSQIRIACLEQLSDTEYTQEQKIKARTTLGLYHVQLTDHIEAKKAIEPIIEDAKRGKNKRLSQIYTILGTHNYLVEEKFTEAFEHLKEALEMSEEEGDFVSLVFSNHWMALLLSFNCEFDKVSTYLQRALDINIAANSLWGISIMKSCMCYYAFYPQGIINQGYITSGEAVRMAEESGDILSKAIAHCSHGFFCYGKGFFDKAIEHLLPGIDFCERINQILYGAMSRFFLGDVYFELGEYQTSQDHLTQGIFLLENNHLLPSWVNFSKVALARSKIMNSEQDIDLDLLRDYARKNKMKLLEGWIRSYLGELLFNKDDSHLPQAQDWIEQAIEADNRRSYPKKDLSRMRIHPS